MKRRDFLALTASVTASGAVKPQLPLQPSVQSGTKVSEARNDYFEFSGDGTECLIKRYDTPVGWLNLLSNGRLVAWAAHDGRIVESCLIDNANNRLTNPESGYIYIRDADSGEHFMLNRPTPGTVWKSAQGLGYTRVTHSALNLRVSATYFVPREDDVLVWFISIRNQTRSRARSRYLAWSSGVSET